MNPRATLHRAERLSSKKLIHSLFKSGKSFYVRPYKVFYFSMNDSEESGTQVLVSVSKRHVKKAVQRNEIKRKIREAYRMNKYILEDVVNKTNGYLAIGIIYTENSLPETADVRKKINKLIQRLKTEIQQ